MLFDVVHDPHEQTDLSTVEPSLTATASDVLDSWRDDCLSASRRGIDPMDVLLDEGGPWHVRGRLLEYADRLRTTGRERWADVLLDKHPREAAGGLPRGGF